MRFNKKFKFNQTFGKRTINEKSISKLKNYAEVFKTKNIKFTSFPFTELVNKFNITSNDFLYLDPPYLITEAGYNAYWSNEFENELYKFLDYLDERNIRFVMSNVSKHKGKLNPNLEKLKNYRLIDIKNDYDKVAKNKIGETAEIIVKNF